MAPPASRTATARPPACSYRQEFDDAVKHNEGLGAHLNKVVDDLHPVRVLQVFSAIPQEVREGGEDVDGGRAGVPGERQTAGGSLDLSACLPPTPETLLHLSTSPPLHSPPPSLPTLLQDCELLDLQGRPEDLLMTHLPVPPVCIRPRCGTQLRGVGWEGKRGPRQQRRQQVAADEHSPPLSTSGPLQSTACPCSFLAVSAHACMLPAACPPAAWRWTRVRAATRMTSP